jgi:hypothetical protein
VRSPTPQASRCALAVRGDEGSREVPLTHDRDRPRPLPCPAFAARRGMPSAVPHPPPTRLRATRSPARWRGVPQDALSRSPLSPAAPQPCVPSDHSPLPSICSCGSHAAPWCGRQVSPRASASDVSAFGLTENLRAGPPGEDVPSATAFFALELDHLSDFKGRAERKRREVSEPGFGHQDKGMASFERQAVEAQCLR